VEPLPAAEIRNSMLQIEQAYRDTWKPASTLKIGNLVDSLPDPFRDEMLVRLIQVDMELGITQSRRPTRHGSSGRNEDPYDTPDDDDEDDRVTPRIELYLLRFPQLRERWEWLSQLIVFEFTLLSKGIHYRPITYYCDSFPEFATSIDELLKRIEANLQRHASTIVSYRGRTTPSNTTVVASSEDVGTTWTLPRTLGRYYLLSFVESGGMGNVFRALDMKRGTLVAIKVMRRDDAWSIHQFNQEFRTLAQIRHPNLVRMHDAFSEGGLRYFSMELITGSDLGRWALENRHDQRYFERLRLFTRQLISVIHHLHQQGVVHRDIKPSNILLRSPRIAVLLDCSLAQRWLLPSEIEPQIASEDVVGTLCYMAPEILQRRPAIPASDWYSLGVSLFELLSGEYPCPKEGDIRQHDQDVDQKLQELAPLAPSDLRLLCQSLLRYDPADRPTGATIAHVMGAPLMEPTRSIKPLIGRGPIFATIRSNLYSTSPDNRLSILYGEPGIGLTAILDHVTSALALNDSTLVLRCASFREDKTSCSIISQLLNQLIDRLRLIDRTEWYPSFMRHAPLIGRHFQEVLIDDFVKDNVPETTSLHESLQAVTQLLVDLSSHRSVMLVIDDLQWCDQDSLNYLTTQLLTSQSFQGRMLAACICSSARHSNETKDFSKSSVLQYLEKQIGVESIFIPPLSLDDMRRILAELTISFQTRNEKQLLDIFNAANGNPSRLQHIARYVAFNFERTNEASDEYRSSIHRWHQAELDALSKTARKITQFLACSTDALKLVTLERLLKVNPDELQSAQEELEETRWIVSTESSDGISLYLADPILRPVILDTLSTALIKRRHQRLAQCLITLHDSPWLRIGKHYEACGRFSRALSAYREAYRHARSDVDRLNAQQAISLLENRQHHS
jgi:eukaryotic-like serine/threonine-protein kinase